MVRCCRRAVREALARSPTASADKELQCLLVEGAPPERRDDTGAGGALPADGPAAGTLVTERRGSILEKG